MITERKVKYGVLRFLMCLTAGQIILVGGCGRGTYSNSWMYPEEIRSVYVEMFDTTSFRRGYEYILTDAVCKRIEAQTPYKIVSDRDQADSVLSGSMSAGLAVLAVDRFTGRPLDQESVIRVTFSWKNLRTGQVLINNETVLASASYSEFVGQEYEYSAGLAVNKAAQRVVERMESPW